MYIEHLSSEFWVLVSRVVQKPAFVMRDMVIQAIAVMQSYVHPRLFEVCREYPWCLAAGCVEENISALHALESPPEESVAKHLWEMLARGFEEQEVVKIVSLMGQASWTSHLSEKLHAAAALMKRRHDYSLSTLVARSFLYSLRQLLAGPVCEEQDIKRQRARVQKLRQKGFAHLTGRQVFLSDMCLRRSVGGPLKLHRLSVHGIMKQHGVSWHTLSQRKRDAYETRARSLRQQKTQEVEEQLDIEVSILQSRLARDSTTRTAGSSCMQSCQLSDSDLVQLEKLFRSDALADYSDDSGESASLAVSDPPPAEAFKHLCSLISPKPKRPAFWQWLLARSELSRDECVILVKVLNSLNAHAAVGDQYETGMAVLEAWTRHNCLEHHGDAWRKHAHTGTRPDEWITENRSMCELVFPKNELDRVLKRGATEGLADLQAEVQILSTSCSLGEQLFSSALQLLSKGKMESIVKESVKELFELSKLSSKDVIDALSSCSRQLEAMPGAELLDKLSAVPLSYRGIEFKHDCSSPLEVAEYTIHTRLRGIMASKSLIGLLPGEDAYTSAECADSSIELTEDVYKKCKRARAHLKSLLDSKPVDQQTGDTLNVLCNVVPTYRELAETHASTLIGIDSLFNIDLHVLRVIMGPDGGKKLKDMWVAKCVDAALAKQDVDIAWKESNSSF
eukprot:2008707-Amphidinium_carterae.3